MGGKARGLDWLVAQGAAVPEYRAVTSAGAALAAYDAVTGPVAVRSSAADEDAASRSRAGHYSTYLGVGRDEVAARVAEVIAAAGAAVVQRMVTADVSGVLFTADPGGLLNETVIEAGHGTGAVVAGVGPTSTYRVCAGETVAETGAGAPELAPEIVRRLVTLGGELQRAAGHPLDIEWALDGDAVWLLQARPITALPPGRVTLDRSNIVESYPGIVSPVTCSFVPRAYAGVFGSLASRLAGRRVAAGLRPVTDRMVEANAGRLYYRLEHWYEVLRLIPFGERYVRVWEESLGVEEGLAGSAGGALALSPWRRFLVGLRLMRQLGRVGQGMQALATEVSAVRAAFPVRLRAATSIEDLARLFAMIEGRLLSRWDVTLLNDAHAFCWPVVLRAWLRLRLVAEPAATANALASHISAIASLAPIRALAALSADAPAGLASIGTRTEAEAYLASDDPFAARLRVYAEEYGDRYLAELVLEAPTLRDPLVLVQTVARGVPPVRVPPAPDGLPHDPLTRMFAGLATRAIGRRESSRLDRARVYGMCRAIVRKAGQILAADGLLDDADDVFWLTLEQVFTGGDGRRGQAAEHRTEWARFAAQPDYHRLVFAGEPHDIVRSGCVVAAEADSAMARAGVGVSTGVATGIVRMVDDPRTASGVDGGVLVTATTDPGWVFLLSRAAAVVAERGSVLSHTAIVARELGVPMVVGVPGATRWLAEGETVKVDGARGEVRRC